MDIELVLSTHHKHFWMEKGILLTSWDQPAKYLNCDIIHTIPPQTVSGSKQASWHLGPHTTQATKQALGSKDWVSKRKTSCLRGVCEICELSNSQPKKEPKWAQDSSGACHSGDEFCKTQEVNAACGAAAQKWRNHRQQPSSKWQSHLVRLQTHKNETFAEQISLGSQNANVGDFIFSCCMWYTRFMHILIEGSQQPHHNQISNGSLKKLECHHVIHPTKKRISAWGLAPACVRSWRFTYAFT